MPTFLSERQFESDLELEPAIKDNCFYESCFRALSGQRNDPPTQILFEGPSPRLAPKWMAPKLLYFPLPAGFISHRVNSPETLVKGGAAFGVMEAIYYDVLTLF